MPQRETGGTRQNGIPAQASVLITCLKHPHLNEEKKNLNPHGQNEFNVILL